MSALVQRPASQVDASWIGRQIIVGKLRGGLSDVELWFGGQHLTVSSDTTVTANSDNFLGGAL